MRRWAILLLIGVLPWSATVLAADPPAATPAIPGPAVGAVFPVDLDAADQSGKPRTLQSLMGRNGLALFFVRSADWCPFCKGQLVDANRRHERFQALGLNVASVSVDSVEQIAAFARDNNIAYTMLADPRGDINLKLGIRDAQYPLGSKAFGVPRPLLYIIGRDGRIRARYMEPTYRTRPDLERVLTEASGIRW